MYLTSVFERYKFNEDIDKDKKNNNDTQHSVLLCATHSVLLFEKRKTKENIKMPILNVG